MAENHSLPSHLRTKIFAEKLINISILAGEKILEIYQREIQVNIKSDNSPVTLADELSENIIIKALEQLTPDIPIVAEESVSKGELQTINPDGYFYLIDPLDGTKEFISRNGEFTVNIAIIENRHPVIGIVNLPSLGVIYWTNGNSMAYRRKSDGNDMQILCRQCPSDGLSVVASRSHRDQATNDYISQFAVKEIVSAGSSLKFCRVAEGTADIYPRFGRTMEWDTAAGDAILRAAGGHVETISGDVLLYGKPGFENPGFIAKGKI